MLCSCDGSYTSNDDEVNKVITDKVDDNEKYSLFANSTVTVNWYRSDGSLYNESGVWCNALNDCSCGISSFIGTKVVFSASISGTYPPFNLVWWFDSTSYDNDSLTVNSSDAGSSVNWIKLYVTDNKSNTVYAKCRAGDQGENMMYIGR